MSMVLSRDECTGMLGCFIRGYETYGNKLELTQDLAKIAQVISGLGNDTYFGNDCCCLEDVVSHTKRLLGKFYRLHDVAHFSASRVDNLFDEASSIVSNGNIVNERESFLANVHQEKRMVSPFDLPISFGDYGSIGGGITIDFVGIPHIDYLDDMLVAFPEIFIDGIIGDLSVPVLGHEVTHSQIESVYGACRDLQNSEVIPIFNEKLLASEMSSSGNLLKEMERRRFKAVYTEMCGLFCSEDVDSLEKTRLSYYITSAIKATHLFDKYANGSDATKKNILGGIQGVFDGEITVEDLLDDNNVTLENSSSVELVKRHI